MFGSPTSLNFDNTLKTLWYIAQIGIDDEEEHQKRFIDWVMHYNIALDHERAYQNLKAMSPIPEEVSGIIQSNNAMGWFVFDDVFGPLTNMADKFEEDQS